MTNQFKILAATPTNSQRKGPIIPEVVRVLENLIELYHTKMLLHDTPRLSLPKWNNTQLLSYLLFKTHFEAEEAYQNQELTQNQVKRIESYMLKQALTQEEALTRKQSLEDNEKAQAFSAHHIKRFANNAETIDQLAQFYNRANIITKLLTGDTNLSQLKVDRLPEYFPLSFLKTVTRLDLSGNQLTDVPSWLGSVRTLKEIDLSSNQLTTHPSWLGSLQLPMLDLSENPLIRVDGITTHGPLYLHNCTDLTQLFGTFNVGGDLDLSNCNNLNDCSFSGSYNVGGDINLEGCTSLTTLPPWISGLGPKPDGTTRQVFLGGSGITRQEIQALTAKGMCFSGFSNDKRVDEFSDLNEALTYWLNHEDDAPFPKLTDLQTDYLLTYLNKLLETAEYELNSTRLFLRSKMEDFLKRMKTDPYFLGKAIDLMSQRISDCNDATIFGILEIEMEFTVLNIERETNLTEREKQLIEYGKRVARFRVVQHCASTKAQEWKELKDESHLGDVEDRPDHTMDLLQMHLEYLLRVARVVDLPITIQEREYSFDEYVSDSDIKAAIQTVQNITEEEYNLFLADWPPLKRCKREQRVFPPFTFKIHPTKRHKGNDRKQKQSLPNQPSYESLSTYKAPIDPDKICPITQQPLKNLEKPVVLLVTSVDTEGNKRVTPQLFEWKDIVQWWIWTEETPTHEPFDITDLQKVPIQQGSIH